MSVLKTYILKKIAVSIGGISVIFIGAIWLTQSLRFLELIVNHNVSLRRYFGLVFYLLPDLVATILPICVLIAGVQIYQKLISDSELAVMRSLGLSNFQIAQPMITAGVMATGFVLCVNLFVIPQSFQNFRKSEFEMRNEVSSSIIGQGTFNILKGVTIYVKSREANGTMHGIFIHKETSYDKAGKFEPAYTIFAKEGVIQSTNGQMTLQLKYGHRQEQTEKDEEVSFLHFDEFSYNLTPLLKNTSKRPIKPYERTLRELFNPDISDNRDMKNKMIIEGHQRILGPFQSLLNALILTSILLYGSLRRRQRKKKVITAIITSLILQGVLMSILNSSTHNLNFLYVAYGIMACFMGVFFMILNDYKLPQRVSSLFGFRERIVS